MATLGLSGQLPLHLMPSESPLVPRIALSGAIDHRASADIIRWRFKERSSTLKLTLLNDGDRIYTNEQILLPNTAISFYFEFDEGSQMLFEGTVVSFAARFTNEGALPTVTVIASGQGPRNSQQQVPLQLGAELLSFCPTIKDDIIHATGEIFGDPSICGGTELAISGAGSLFDRTYLAQSTIHRFDHNGYRVEFTALASLSSF